MDHIATEQEIWQWYRNVSTAMSIVASEDNN